MRKSLVQEQIAFLTHRRPDAVDGDILSDMQHVLVICRDDFKQERTSRHLTRIIGIQSFFRKKLREAMKTLLKSGICA